MRDTRTRCLEYTEPMNNKEKHGDEEVLYPTFPVPQCIMKGLVGDE